MITDIVYTLPAYTVEETSAQLALEQVQGYVQRVKELFPSIPAEAHLSLSVVVTQALKDGPYRGIIGATLTTPKVHTW